jgi:hypothetical protein
MSEPDWDPGHASRPLRAALVLTAIAVLLALVLLFRETAYTFVVFMFLGPPLVLFAVVLIGWVAWKELRAKKVL